MKHRIKMLLREGWAKLLFHTRLHWLVDLVSPRRLLILAGHAVAMPGRNDSLAAEMKISERRLEEILRWLGARYELCTVGEGLAELRKRGRRSLVALSMDDGYRDNHEALLPLLERVGARATVFLEGRPIAEQRVNWTHKLFWLLERQRPEDFVLAYTSLSEDEPGNERLREVLQEGKSLEYRLKLVLKYEANGEERDRAIDTLFTAAGGDERRLCRTLYMSPDQARDLAAHGVEIGAHTVSHNVLSSLTPAEQRYEIAIGRTSLERALDLEIETFAYPFGRSWDFDQGTVEAVRDAGFRAAVTTHAGVNRRSSDPLRLARWMIDDRTPLHLIVAEACGGFDLLRRIGLDLSE